MICSFEGGVSEKPLFFSERKIWLVVVASIVVNFLVGVALLLSQQNQSCSQLEFFFLIIIIFIYSSKSSCILIITIAKFHSTHVRITSLV